jgi:chlorite dismutase
MQHNFFDFIGAEEGTWKTQSIQTLVGEPIPHAPFLTIQEGSLHSTPQATWALKGFKSNIRYTEKAEKIQLNQQSVSHARVEDTCATLIPIRKSEAWWELTQDERRAIFEQQSKHIAIGLRYIPAISRQLFHCRDIGQPFDFLTWFEFSPENVAPFEDLLASLRASEEWTYVDREIDIRFIKLV